jgi:TrpR-related protein YerC/YecD
MALADEKEYHSFLLDLCTESELEVLIQRLKVADLLVAKETYQRIAEITGVSTATISRVKRILNEGRGGCLLALERLKEMGDLE